MRKVILAAMAAALWSGCAHEGGMSDESYRETGSGSSTRLNGPSDRAPGLPNTTDRDFPSRVGPGLDQPLDPRTPW